MDGVLVDTEPEYMKLELMMCEEIGITLSEKQKKIYVGSGPVAMWTDLKKRYGFSQDPHVLAQTEIQLMDEYYRSGALIPIKPTLELLKSCVKSGLKAAVATSSKKENAENVIRRLGLGGYVSAISAGDMVKAAKPSPDIFLLAAKLLGVAADECIVVEDAKHGITAAKKAGMKAIALKSPASAQDLTAADIVTCSLGKICINTLHALFV
jgi:HAD superfamily hydrolase (TIGR01509 family)